MSNKCFCHIETPDGSLEVKDSVARELIAVVEEKLNSIDSLNTEIESVKAELEDAATALALAKEELEKSIEDAEESAEIAAIETKIIEINTTLAQLDNKYVPLNKGVATTYSKIYSINKNNGIEMLEISSNASNSRMVPRRDDDGAIMAPAIQKVGNYYVSQKYVQEYVEAFADGQLDELYEVTPESRGLMSAADKAKLDGIEAGAQKNVVYSNATTTSAGLMSAADKTKLNNLSTGGGVYNNSVVITGYYISGSKNIELLFYTNIYSKYEKDYGAVSTFLAEITEREGMSLIGTGVLTISEDTTFKRYDILRLRVYDGKLKAEYYDDTNDEYVWTEALNNYISTSCDSVSM